MGWQILSRSRIEGEQVIEQHLDLGAGVYDPATIECPWRFDSILRKVAPVHYDRDNNIYLISTYDLIKEVLHAPHVYSSRYMEKMLGKEPFPAEVMQIYAQGYEMRDALLVTDGATHIRHRQIISAAFSRKRLAELSPALENKIDAVLNRAMPKGSFHFRAEIAEAVPLLLTEQQLRIPSHDMPKATKWSAILSSGFGGIDKSLNQLKDEAAELVAFQRYFAVKIQTEMQRIAETGSGFREDDLISLLARSVQDPQDPMDMAEAISFLLNLFPATHDTTTTSMIACMHRYASHPSVQEAIRGNPAYISKLIEETMRHETPVRAWWRRALEDVPLGGTLIPEGAWLLLRISGAHRDPAAYLAPDLFDIERRSSLPHLGFSTGIHICAGRFFARHIIGRVIAKLSERATNFRFVEGANDFLHTMNLLASGYQELVICFDRR